MPLSCCSTLSPYMRNPFCLIPKPCTGLSMLTGLSYAGRGVCKRPCPDLPRPGSMFHSACAGAQVCILNSRNAPLHEAEQHLKIAIGVIQLGAIKCHLPPVCLPVISQELNKQSFKHGAANQECRIWLRGKKKAYGSQRKGGGVQRG